MERTVSGAGALAGRNGDELGFVVVGSWGLLLKPGVLDLGPWQCAGVLRVGRRGPGKIVGGDRE